MNQTQRKPTLELPVTETTKAATKLKRQGTALGRTQWAAVRQARAIKSDPFQPHLLQTLRRVGCRAKHRHPALTLQPHTLFTCFETKTTTAEWTKTSGYVDPQHGSGRDEVRRWVKTSCCGGSSQRPASALGGGQGQRVPCLVDKKFGIRGRESRNANRRACVNMKKQAPLKDITISAGELQACVKESVTERKNMGILSDRVEVTRNLDTDQSGWHPQDKWRHKTTQYCSSGMESRDVSPGQKTGE